MTRFWTLRWFAVAGVITGGLVVAGCREGRNQGNQFLAMSGPRAAPEVLVYSCAKLVAPSQVALWTVRDHRKADLVWEGRLSSRQEEVQRVPVDLGQQLGSRGLVDGRTCWRSATRQAP